MPQAFLRLPLFRLSFAACCLLAATPVFAITVTKVQVNVSGPENEALADNVRSALALNEEVGKDISTRRLNYLLREVEAETREALEPFGYYSPTITIQRSDRSAAEDVDDRDVDPNNGESDTDRDVLEASTGNVTEKRVRRDRTLTVSIQVDPGTPVRIREFTLGITGEAERDASVQSALTAFVPRKGAVLDHEVYEASKGKINRALATHGYFDADLPAHRVEVTRADFAADIDLRWTSGKRFALGEATFIQAPKPIIRDNLLQKLVHWEAGDAYDEVNLERLRRSLAALDYFGLVEVLPQPDQAGDDKVVPVQVNLTAAPRSIYTTGLSYGTLSGAGVRLGVERRYLNTRGHKALAQLDYARKRKTATLQYRVPAFAWLDGWYTASLQAADEQTDFLDTRRLEFVASRSGQFNEHLNLIASLHVLRERWNFFSLTMPVPVYQYASFAFPELRAEYIDVDNKLAPRRGAGGTLLLRAGTGIGNASENFAQIHASAQWFHGFDADSRLLVRGEIGHTFTKVLFGLPPSLRFYAGGDHSVRGYGWREIGPRTRNGMGETYALGAQNVVTASVEYERYFMGPWGAAVFIDSGSAFDGKSPDMRTGVGVGLRWRSPVGPVRIDIAHGLDQPDSPITLHLNIGADL
ncbi:MAG: autotransporter assembly complex family protein [Thermomonas sp.]